MSEREPRPSRSPDGATSSLRQRVGDVIFETDRPLARAFDVALLVAILASVLLVMLESVAGMRARFGMELRALEWIFTTLFTIEYALRLWTAYDRRRYALSFFGIVDLLAVLPSYLSLVFVGSQYFIVIRALRLLRVFRVLKLVRFLGEASVLARALRASRAKITVFLVAVVAVVVIIGSAMFLVEGPANGFTDIPTGVYWAIVTLTTVGFGDIAPQTAAGKALAAVVMVLGYGVIAVPTGIVTSELSRADRGNDPDVRAAAAEFAEDEAQRRAGGADDGTGAETAPDARACARCGLERHEPDARYCRRCGEALPA